MEIPVASPSLMSLARVPSPTLFLRHQLMDPSLEACLFLEPRVSEFQS